MAQEDLLSPIFVQLADTLIEGLQPPIEFLHRMTGR